MSDEENSSLTPKDSNGIGKYATQFTKPRWADKRKNQGKPIDIENQDQHVKMEDRTSQTSTWKFMEDCLKRDDSETLEKMIKEQNFQSVLRPPNAPVRATILHKAVEFDCTKCLNLLIRNALENSVDGEFLIDSPNNDGRTPLFMAVGSAQKQAVTKLLEASAHVNARDDSGSSVLHLIAFEVSKRTRDENQRKSLLECLDILLDNSDIDLEAKDNTLHTPLVKAADIFTRNPSNTLNSFCKKLILKGASLEACISEGKSVKQLLNNSVLTPEILRERKPAPKRPILSQLLDSLLAGDGGEGINQILSGRDETETSKLSNSYLGKRPLLFFAIKINCLRTVKALLEAGADSWKKDLSGELCLHSALSKGNPKILECIIINMKGKKNIGRCEKINMWDESFSFLQNILENHHRDLIPQEDVDHMMCLKIFLRDVKVDVNACVTGDINQSILHLAASFNNQEAAKLLLEGGAFLGSRKTVFQDDRGTVLKVIRPETLNKAMDGCISSYQESNQANPFTPEDITSPDYTLNLNYQFLIPPFTKDSKGSQESKPPDRINEVQTLMEVSENKIHRKAIKHPLIQTFLYAKWRKVLPLYILNLILYLVFVILLTLFMYGVKDLRISEEKLATSKNLSNVLNSTVLEDIDYKRNTVYILKVFLVLFTLYILAREIFQVIYTFRHYLKDFENYLEWFLIIIVMIFCFAHSSITVDLTRHFAAWAMIIAWYEFVLLLGRAPPLAIYVTMLRNVSWNFLKLIFLYGALILAFSVSFNIILQPTTTSQDGDTDFNNFWSTLPKSIVMATGEFDYSDLRGNFSSSQAFYTTSAVLVFLVFVFLIFLVLMNVMSGLAVSDTQEVMDEATLYSLKSRLELIYLIEEMLLVLRSQKLLSMVHLISDPNIPNLTVRINLSDSCDRIVYGDGKQMHFCKLDDDTTDVLRSYRIQQLTEEAAKAKIDPAKQCLQILKELRKIAHHNPQLLTGLSQSNP